MGVEALCQVSKINGSCHLKMVDAGVSGCYHYYMNSIITWEYAGAEYNISQAAQHKNGEQRTFLRISAMKSGGRRENEPIFSEKMEENTGFSVFYRQKC